MALIIIMAFHIQMIWTRLTIISIGQSMKEMNLTQKVIMFHLIENFDIIERPVDQTTITS